MMVEILSVPLHLRLFAKDQVDSIIVKLLSHSLIKMELGTERTLMNESKIKQDRNTLDKIIKFYSKTNHLLNQLDNMVLSTLKK